MTTRIPLRSAHCGQQAGESLSSGSRQKVLRARVRSSEQTVLPESKMVFGDASLHEECSCLFHVDSTPARLSLPYAHHTTNNSRSQRTLKHETHRSRFSQQLLGLVACSGHAKLRVDPLDRASGSMPLAYVIDAPSSMLSSSAHGATSNCGARTRH